MKRRLISSCLIGGVRLYQRWINPILKAFSGPGAGCRFHPTCSHFMINAIQIHGPARGTWLGIKRIARCHPWGPYGHDPVPPREFFHSNKKSPDSLP